MTLAVRPRLLLLDFDGVLAHYSHERRIAHLARTAGCEPARVADVLFASGLETEYDSGRIDTSTYLRRLGDGLGRAIDEAAWIASRLAGSRADPGVIEQVLAAAARTPVGVLTNNGALMAQAESTSQSATRPNSAFMASTPRLKPSSAFIGRAGGAWRPSPSVWLAPG